jgi:hypothetical protein
MKKARKTSKALRPAGLKIKIKTGIKAAGYMTSHKG